MAINIDTVISYPNPHATQLDVSSLRAFLSGKQALTGQGLINLLKTDPELVHLYSLSAGVGEGYTIEEHTCMVLDSFQREFADRPNVQATLQNARLTPEEFTLFLALHDIGKGRAVQQFFGACPERKELELKYSTEEIMRCCTLLNLPHLVPIFEGLLLDDSIGDFLKKSNPTQLDAGEAARCVEKGAEKCGLKSHDFLAIKTLFHQIDAASYYFVRDRFFKCDKDQTIELGSERFPRYIGYSDANIGKIGQLKVALEASFSPQATATISIADYRPLLKASVWDYSIQDITVLEGILKRIKQAEGSSSTNYIALKEKLVEIRQARLPFRSYVMWKHQNTEFKTDFFGYEKLIQKTDRSEKKQQLLQCVSSPQIEERLQLLSRLTFVHGSNSAALVMMSLMEQPQLQCTGALLAQGIAPMCGELINGVGTKGVNMRSLSVETIRDIGRVKGYSTMCPFDPSRFNQLQNPLLSIIPIGKYELENFAIKLQTWKVKDPMGFQKALAPERPANLLLINALQDRIKSLRSSCFEMEQQLAQDPKRFSHFQESLERTTLVIEDLNTIIATLSSGQDLKSLPTASDISWQDLRKAICIPYSNLSSEDSWNRTAIQLRQLQQWNYTAFAQEILPHREEWLLSLDEERRKSEQPLRHLIAIIDHNFTPEEKQFISDAIDKKLAIDTQIPASLQPLFATMNEIPTFWSSTNFDVSTLKREIGFYRTGSYRWSDIIERTLSAKIRGEEESMLQKMKPIYENELHIIGRNYRYIISALQNDQPTIQIPQDENTRSLITEPIPVIFSSTAVKPKPFLPQLRSEYVVSHPVPLGKGGCDILFTDTPESRERIKAILPVHLNREIEIHLIEELDVGSIPLIHAPDQIDETSL
ncbi:MAG: hypothetical protein JSR57_05240 [Verrucomicrobia bacterium]|nr:hypothetical protein [Verrucomicrobiota bacterium]